MKKRSKLSIFLLLVFMAVTVMTMGIMPVYGADDFKADMNGDGALFYGRGEAQLTGAISKKMNEINARLTVLSEGMTTDAEKIAAFDAAIADGEILIYNASVTANVVTLKNNGLLASGGDNSNRRDGFKTWENMMFYELKLVHDGHWVDYWDGGLALISYDAVKDDAYLVSGIFADRIFKSDDSSRKLGVAVGDRFKATDGNWYQNFTGGYIKATALTGNGATVTSHVFQKNVGADGVEIEIRDIANTDGKIVAGNSTGMVGGIAKDKAIPNGLSRDVFSKLFQDTYFDYAAAGSNIGSPFGPIQLGNGDAYKWTAQEFIHGDSNAAPWGSGDARRNWSYLAYNSEVDKVFWIKDRFMEVFEKKQGGEARHQIGEPTSNEFEITVGGTATKYQNFANGYLTATGDNACAIVVGKNINETTGEEFTIDAMDKLGVISNLITLPAGISKEALSKMVKDSHQKAITDYKYDSMIPDGIVASKDGMIQQIFEAKKTTSYNDGTSTVETGTVKIIFNDTLKKTFFMNIASTRAYKSQLGLPNTEIIQVADGEGLEFPAVNVQGFVNGYIKLVVTQQYDDAWKEIEVEVGYRTVGASYNETYKYFEAINYAKVDNSSVGRLATGDSGNDLKPDSAPEFWEAAKGEDLTKLFKDAYQEIFEKGFSVGEPTGQGVVYWLSSKSGVIKQGFKGGSGTANFWDDNSVLMYDVFAKKVRLVTDQIANEYTEGAAGNGFPVSDMMIELSTGNLYQNFVCWDRDDANKESLRYTLIMYNKATNTTSKQQGVTDAIHIDFAAEADKYVAWLDQYASEDVTFNFTPEARYNLNSTITIDLKQYMTNNSKYYIVYDEANVSKGTFANGVWTYTAGNAAEKFDIELTMYTAFSKITFKTSINIADAAAVDPSPDPSPDPDPGTDPTKPNKPGCNGKGEAASAVVFLALSMAFIAVKRKI